MSDRLVLEVVDEDVAASAALDDLACESRSRFLQKAVFAGGTLVAGGVLIGGLPRVAASAPNPAQDMKILNLALLLEYLESAFYADAVRKGRVNAELLEYAKVVGAQERAHVAFLKKALGKNARKQPKFEFGDATASSKKFGAAATMLEDAMVAAYNGQAANLTKPTLAAAAKIVSVEARHAGWIRAITGKNPAPNATDNPRTAAEVTALVNRTEFIRSS
jgi:Ferritin-like domain